MTLRFVVMEDMGTRSDALKAICRATRPGEGGPPFAHLADEDVLRIPPDIAEFGPEDLAEVDAVFVDFDLQVRKTAGYTGWAPFALADGTEYKPETGMSVLLHLREVMESSTYQRAREARVAQLPTQQREWLGTSGATRLFAFVAADEPVSTLFAAAAVEWFDATFYYAQPDVRVQAELTEALHDLVVPRHRVDELEMPARLFHLAVVPAFAQMLGGGTDYRGRNTQLIPDKDLWPSTFDMYRIYLAHRGKFGFGTYHDPAGFRDAAFRVCGIRLEPHSVVKQSTDALFTRMQGALEHFHGEADTNADAWPDWSGLSGAEDAMLDYLLDSQLFWTSADVRLAFDEHLRRTGQST